MKNREVIRIFSRMGKICLWAMVIMVVAIAAAILAGITNIVSDAVTVPLTVIFVIVLLIFGFIFLLTNVRSMMTFIYFRKQNYFVVFGNSNSRVVFMPEDIKAVSVKPYSAVNIKSGEHIYDEARTIGMGGSAQVLVLDIVPHVDPVTGAMPKASFFKRLTRANVAFQLIIWCPEIERLKQFFLEKRPDLAVSNEQHVDQLVELVPRQVIVQRRLVRFVMPIIIIIIAAILTSLIFTFTGKVAGFLAAIVLVAGLLTIALGYGRRTVVKLKLYSDRITNQIGTFSQFRLEYNQIQAISCETIEPLNKPTYRDLIYSVGLSRTTQAVNVYLEKFTEQQLADVRSKKQQPLEVLQIRCLRPQEIADAIQLWLDAYHREQPARISEENSDLIQPELPAE